ncbi:MAG: hypothetical protein HYS13_25505 [Planctomycetia bacterium]|nr:hypothetical protein [Planctomycetia bacterium]
MQWQKLLKAALLLPETERLILATQLLESIPADDGCWSVEDPGFLEELDRRSSDGSTAVPLSELWDNRR